jgi:hypothetical protein
MIDWYKRYGTAVLQKILNWDTDRIAAWARHFEHFRN